MSVGEGMEEGALRAACVDSSMQVTKNVELRLLVERVKKNVIVTHFDDAKT